MSEADSLPDAPNLTEFVAQNLEGVPKGDAEVKVQPAEPAQPALTEIKVDGKTVQFKTAEEAYKAYTEVQGFASRLAQENKTLKEQQAGVAEQLELMRMQQVPAQPYVQTYVQPENFDSQFISNPEMAIQSKVAEQVATARIAEVLDEESVKNPTEFQERYAYAKMMANQYPGLLKTGNGVRKLFELGDKKRTENLRVTAERAMKLTFGDNIDIEQMRAAFAKKPNQQQNTNLAYMPDTGSATSQLRPQTGNTGIDSQIKEAAAKGDIDMAIAGVFKKMLATT